MAPGDGRTITFLVTVNAGVPIGTVISNTCNTEYDTATIPNANLSTPCPTANITVTGPPQDLTIDKRHTGNFTSGTPGSFQIEVANAGALPVERRDPRDRPDPGRSHARQRDGHQLELRREHRELHGLHVERRRRSERRAPCR